MMGGNYFDMLNCVGKLVRNNSAPFGGIQLVLSGDLLQLPPVKDILVFESGTWEELKIKTFILSKPWRFNDAEYIELLQRVRTFSQTRKDIEVLQSRCADKFDENYLADFYKDAVVIFPLKKDVDKYNKEKLNAVSTDLVVVTSTDNRYKKNAAPEILEKADIAKNIYEDITDQDYKSDTSKSDTCCICLNDFENGDKVKYLPCFHMFHSQEINTWLERSEYCPLCKKSVKDELLKLEQQSKTINEFKSEEDTKFENIFPCSQYLYLKPNCKVMLLINLDVKLGLVNGSIGTVKSISNNIVKVEFNKIEVEITPHEFVYEDYDVILTRRQFPLTLAYALSIHKCQGSTIDKIVVDLGKNIFVEGQAYVALSRCKNLQSVIIKDFYPDRLKTNREAIKVEKNLRKEAIFL
jgi:ATP-dependent DNA helicase PIF1